MRIVSAFVGLALATLSNPVFAQDVPPPDAATIPAGVGAAASAPAVEGVSAPAPPDHTAFVYRGLTVGADTLQVTLPVVLSLSEDQMLKPVWIPLELRFGATDRLDVFLSHNQLGPAIPLAFRGGGLCIGGRDRSCPKVYDNLNLGAELSFLKNAGIELSGIAAVEIRSIDRGHVAADLGLDFKYNGGPVAIKAAASIGVAVSHRYEQIKELIAVPVQVAWQASRAVAVFMDTGVFSTAEDLSRDCIVPVGVGAAVAVRPTLDVGAELMFPQVLSGSSDNLAFDKRMAMIYASLRTK